MARFNEILVGRYNRFLQKLFGLKGGPPAPQLASEIMPVFPHFSGAEHRYLESWDRFGATLLAPQVASVTSGVQIRNPAGSNVVAVLEKILVNTTVIGDVVVLGNGVTADLPTVVTGVQLDKRGRVGSTCIVSANTVASVGASNPFLSVKVVVNTPFDFIVTDIQEITLLPGDGILAKMGAVSEDIRVSFLWRERFLEEGERT